jgi:hypothetical protein
MADRDFTYELGLLERINATEVNETPIAQWRMNDVALWQSYQQFLFDADIQAFAKAGSFAEYQKQQKSYQGGRIKRFLVSLLLIGVTLLASVWLILSRRKVLLFSVDKVSDKTSKSDFRIAPLYNALREEKVRFIECFHTSVGISFVKNLFTRGRLALYLEGIDALWYACRLFGHQAPTLTFGSISGTEDEQQFIRYIIKKYVGVFPLLEFRISFFEKLLQHSAVRLVTGVDDARHYHALVEAAHRAGIPSMLLQHGGGHFTPYHPGWLSNPVFGNGRYMRADTLVVWSDYWKDELLRLGSVYPEESLIVGGLPQTLQNPFLPKLPNTKVILIPYETDAPKNVVAEYLNACTHCLNTEVYFKLRPDVARSTQLAPYGSVQWEKIHIETELKNIPAPTLVLGVYSTFLYDMVRLGIPIALMKTDMVSGQGMVRNALANELSLAKVCDAVLVDAEVLLKRTKRLQSDKNLDQTLRGLLHTAKVI